LDERQVSVFAASLSEEIAGLLEVPQKSPATPVLIALRSRLKTGLDFPETHGPTFSPDFSNN
jgi:hypothetical protein